MNLTNFDKAIVSAAPLLVTVLSGLGVMGLPAGAMWWVNLAVALITPLAVYLKSNKPPAA